LEIGSGQEARFSSCKFESCKLTAGFVAVGLNAKGPAVGLNLVSFAVGKCLMDLGPKVFRLKGLGLDLVWIVGLKYCF
jgi:hypothetical protein